MTKIRLITPLWFLIVGGCYDFSIPTFPTTTDAAVLEEGEGIEEEPWLAGNGTSSDGTDTGDVGAGTPVCNKVSCKEGCCDENNKCQIAAASTLPDASANASITYCGIGGSKCVPCALDHAEAKCDTKGKCVVAACESNYDNCDGKDENGCEADLTLIDNCGKCHKTCTKLPRTEAPSCNKTDGGYECGFLQCELGWGECNNTPQDGCEANLNTDFNNCHECGNACPGSQICKDGYCR